MIVYRGDEEKEQISVVIARSSCSRRRSTAVTAPCRSRAHPIAAALDSNGELHAERAEILKKVLMQTEFLVIRIYSAEHCTPLLGFAVYANSARQKLDDSRKTENNLMAKRNDGLLPTTLYSNDDFLATTLHCWSAMSGQATRDANDDEFEEPCTDFCSLLLFCCPRLGRRSSVSLRAVLNHLRLELNTVGVDRATGIHAMKFYPVFGSAELRACSVLGVSKFS